MTRASSKWSARWEDRRSATRECAKNLRNLLDKCSPKHYHIEYVKGWEEEEYGVCCCQRELFMG